jgi:hypothetical protein
MAHVAAIANPVTIGNMALSNCGSSASIESFNENSVEAKLIKRWYDFARFQVLESSDWNFARKRAFLALHSEAPPNDWGFRYKRPADCVKVRRIINPAGETQDEVPFQIMTTDDGDEETILCNVDDAEVEYTFNLQNTGQYNSLFITALAFLLGHYICLALTGKQQIAEANLRNYFNAVRIAQAINGNEQGRKPDRDAEWVRER